ncbi:MAG: hypothetical protein J6334_06180 [Kiritimatiellae bacterium]|nr:hypothetical protein [Kiritimatiellia bacterium]
MRKNVPPSIEACIFPQNRANYSLLFYYQRKGWRIFMGTGRTLNKNPRTRPIKTPGEKARRAKAQRARLVKLGMDEADVAKMQPEAVRKLAMHSAAVKKAVAKKAAAASAAAAE